MDFILRLARSHAVIQKRFDSALGSLHGISFSDFQMLDHLGRAAGGKLRRVDLAERLGLTASGVTRALLPLEKIGLVGRETDPRDARVGYAVITDTGRALLADARVLAESLNDDLTRSIDPGTLAALSQVLGNIAGIHAGNA